MDIKYSNIIQFEKELNNLDKFVIMFTKILNKLEIKYVIISGYVSILFGRNRTSEDIDLIVEKIDFEKFKKLWKEIYHKFECLNTENVKEAYDEYLCNNIPIRFSIKKIYMPNMEFKFIQPKLNQLDIVALTERKKVILNHHIFFISPLELQIAFKLFLGSEKDIEDARYLYNIFKNKLNNDLLSQFNRKLKIEKVFNKHIK